jgi:hypothetical protein
MACASRKRCLFFDRHVPEYTLSASRGTNREYGAGSRAIKEIKGLINETLAPAPV